MKIFNFNNNDSFPCIGLGAWKSTGSQVKSAVTDAINAGYRHIDTSEIYGNELEIGEALTEVIKIGIIKREDVFIT